MDALLMGHPIIDQSRPDLCKVLKREEGLRLRPYLCSAGVPTIGVGATTYPDGRPVQLSDPPITERQAMQMLAVEADRYMQQVLGMCKVWPSSNQLVALASLAYNIGVAGLRGSTVMRLHNRGDHAGAGRAFALWNKARVNGRLQPLAGLTARRARESALYLTPDDDAFRPDGMPQAIATESRLLSSPIAVSGGATSTAGAALGLMSLSDGLGTTSDTVGQAVGLVQQIRDAVPIDPLMLLAVVVLVAGAVGVYNRWKQRNGGWA